MMAAVTELSDAVRAGDVRTVQSILGREPPLASSRDADGTSLVLLACTSGHRRVLDALLAAGAEPDARDASGQTAADLAVAGGHAELAAMLR